MTPAEIERGRISALDAGVPDWRERDRARRDNSVELRIRDVGDGTLVAIVHVPDINDRRPLHRALLKQFPGITVKLDSRFG